MYWSIVTAVAAVTAAFKNQNKISWKIILALWLDKYIYVPQNGVQTNYVPQVPHMGYRWGTKLVPPQDGDKIHRFLGWFEKIWVPPHFLVGLIYRLG